MLIDWITRKYKEQGKISIAQFIENIKPLADKISNNKENIIKLANFAITEFFGKSTIKYQRDAYSHEYILKNYTGNCLIRARLLGAIFDHLEIPTIGAIAPGHFFTILKLPNGELVSLDGEVSVIKVEKENGFQIHEKYSWLVLGNHNKLIYSSTMAWKGSASRIEGDLQKATTFYLLAFEASLKEAYSCPDFVFNYANILLLQNKYCEAAMNYNRCLSIYDKYDEARDQLLKLIKYLESMSCREANCTSSEIFCYHQNKFVFSTYNSVELILSSSYADTIKSLLLKQIRE